MIKDFLLHKDKENGNHTHNQAHLAVQNTGDRFAAKRAFILHAHPNPPTNLDNSLTRTEIMF
ncbi:hypothetical protein [Xiashengella succiniciproducens]|uniref:Uncharacterized protein n=1 Tax=Xiashengella succiniciproducens TaxID=2949635 RepID=A0A9J6ZTK7_9BACT|nr:hypothetical protein [Alkaliflexus sp. Ai-910]URW80931.1 hypothetical protein M9189_06145 [Alkaliflexus sp. Ai-910]